MQKKKVIVIGLDCACPRTLFEDFKDECPNIKRLMETGVYGKLRSSDPPITIPAWMVMVTGKNAGELGIYGFRNRKGNSYTEYDIANSRNITEPKIWDIIGKKGLKSIILGIPPSFPTYPINGQMVSGFITPDILSNFTYPAELKEEISEIVEEYILDVKFRTDLKERVLKEIYKMSKAQFSVIKHLIKNKEWDYCQFVIIGLDRIHHAFWKYYDKYHPKYEQGNMFETVIKNYYRYLDKEIGEIINSLDDNTIVMVVSDHGAKAMKGCICVNMALERLNLLKFKKQPKSGTRLEETEIDWNNTFAWGWGGYYARIFLNVKGREKCGVIEPEEYEKYRDKISELLKEIPDNQGNPMRTKVFKPQELYKKCSGNYPDLMVYFDDLNWRSAGTLGYENMYLDENDTGPDDAVHDIHGIFIISDPKKKIGKELTTKDILDIAPTVLNIFGIQKPDDMEGTSIDF